LIGNQTFALCIDARLSGDVSICASRNILRFQFNKVNKQIARPFKYFQIKCPWSFSSTKLTSKLKDLLNIFKSNTLGLAEANQ